MRNELLVIFYEENKYEINKSDVLGSFSKQHIGSKYIECLFAVQTINYGYRIKCFAPFSEGCHC